MPLKINTKAPDFNLPSTSGASFQLEKTMEGKPCILYFYPKDFTQTCTKEACEFRDHFAELRDLNIDVFGISTDSIETHLRFKELHRLPFELLADTEGRVAKQYKAQVPIINLTRRVTYLLDAQHTIVAVYENMFASREHVELMIAKLKSA